MNVIVTLTDLHCLGSRWSSHTGTLDISLLDILHESALYWHMQNDEWSVYQAQEAAWRAQLWTVPHTTYLSCLFVVGRGVCIVPEAWGGTVLREPPRP